MLTTHIHHASHIHHTSITHTDTPSVELENFWIYKLKLQTFLLICRHKRQEGGEDWSNGKHKIYEARLTCKNVNWTSTSFHGVPVPPPLLLWVLLPLPLWASSPLPPWVVPVLWLPRSVEQENCYFILWKVIGYFKQTGS